MTIHKKCFFFACIFLCLQASSQNITGSWYGIGKVQLPGTHDHYLAELLLVQKGKEIKGDLNYYFRDSLFTNKIEGSFDAMTRKLVLKKIPVIYHGSATTKEGVDVMMTGDLTLRISKTESLLLGDLLSDEDYKYTAPSIGLVLKKSTDSTSVVTVKEPLKPTVVATPRSIPSEEAEKQKLFEKRENIFDQVVEVSSPTIKIEVYDNGAIDYDSVSLYFNKKLVLPKTMLNHRAIRMTLTLDSTIEYNELSMFADNLGMIPPNTAALILYDGKKRYEIQMTSDMDKNATIRLRRKKTNN